ncbi:acyl-CoA dehydrogenase family protein, partial [Granulicatella adiacens]
MFLSEELLQEIHERAPRYDKENAWPAEDYAALKEAGYLKAFVPKEYGGFGLSLKEIAQEQTRLAMAAPGTALGVNMHQIIVGLGKHMVRFGNKKGEQILRDAAEGKLLAFGIS